MKKLQSWKLRRLGGSRLRLGFYGSVLRLASEAQEDQRWMRQRAQPPAANSRENETIQMVQNEKEVCTINCRKPDSMDLDLVHAARVSPVCHTSWT
jgi:hypothetical protein